MELDTLLGQQHGNVQRRCPTNTSNQPQPTLEMRRPHWLLARVLWPKPHCSSERPEMLLKRQSEIGGPSYVSFDSGHTHPHPLLRPGFVSDLPIALSWNECFLPLTGLSLYMYSYGNCCGTMWSQSSSYYVCPCPLSISIMLMLYHRSITP